MPVPAYIRLSDVAKACRLSRDSAFTELKNAKLLERRGRLWKVSRSRFRERLPDMFDDVYEYFDGLDGGRSKHVGAPGGL
jgi:hypothetical protein